VVCVVVAVVGRTMRLRHVEATRAGGCAGPAGGVREAGAATTTRTIVPRRVDEMRVGGEAAR
jgi:hypothetical protein